MIIKNKVYKLVKLIPEGKVSTYGRLAELVKTSPRAVGNILHHNPDPEHIPCHRVVSNQGKLAQNFAFGGIKGQAQRLRSEGVAVRNSQVDLEKYFWMVK